MRLPWRKSSAEVKQPWLDPEQDEPQRAQEADAGESPAPSPFAAPAGHAEEEGGEPATAAGHEDGVPQAPEAPVAPEPEPSPVIPVSESSFRQPPATAPASGDGAPGAADSPPVEVLAGAAFAGGLMVAMLLRRVLS